MIGSDKPIKKPILSSSSKTKMQQTVDSKLKRKQRYHIASIYRQLKIPLYQKLLALKKENKSQNNIVIEKTNIQIIDILNKYASLNSKYRHRQKVRFQRTPLMKYIQFDFAKLKSSLNNKKIEQKYEDLYDDEDEDDQKPMKQYIKDPSFSQITINNYKKKHQINGKIFIALGYDDLKDGLIQRGWTEVEDTNSLIYDLKFMSKKKNIDYVNLLNNQYINHFQQNKNITAKFGLCRNIRNLAIIGKNSTQFFPKCYDINDIAQLQDFYEEFKISQVQSILLFYLKSKGLANPNQTKIIKLCFQIMNRSLLSFQQLIQNVRKGRPLYIKQTEWKQIKQFNKNEGTQKIINQQLFKQINILYQKFKNNDSQWSLNKDNIWIVKPASMSRGRGIKTFSDLQQILEYIVGRQISWVVQKYIQAPLIVRKKKFDIRQWVLWTDFKPLKVWMYQQCYIRFCAEIYTPQNLKNRKIHLTNNSVTKGINLQSDGIQGNMMDQVSFNKQLQSQLGKQVFYSIIKPQMKKIIIQSLQSVLQNVQYRKNSFQILGYDFMIDQYLKVWLIQVNSSPTMEYSTKVTQKLVKRGMHDLAGVVQHYITSHKIYKQQKKEQYGGWQLIT